MTLEAGPQTTQTPTPIEARRAFRDVVRDLDLSNVVVSFGPYTDTIDALLADEERSIEEGTKVCPVPAEWRNKFRDKGLDGLLRSFEGVNMQMDEDRFRIPTPDAQAIERVRERETEVRTLLVEAEEATKAETATTDIKPDVKKNPNQVYPPAQTT